MRWLWVLLIGCGNGPLMTPGQDCQQCHARRFTVSGTVFESADALVSAGLEGASVVVTDADGRSVAMDTNAAGNFYTEEPMRFPLTAELRLGNEVRKMAPLVDRGGCNDCHDVPAKGSASGRIFIKPE